LRKDDAVCAPLDDEPVAFVAYFFHCQINLFEHVASRSSVAPSVGSGRRSLPLQALLDGDAPTSFVRPTR